MERNRCKGSTVYYVDSEKGDDENSGIDPNRALKSITRLQDFRLQPGDTVFFKRGSSFDGLYRVLDSGEPGRNIVFTSYGDSSIPAPAFTNQTFEQDNFGNCFRISGDHILIEGLLFQHTPAFKEGNYDADGFDTWEMGAVHIDKTAAYCTVRRNEFFDCVAAIRSNGTHIRISENYIHDCNRVLKKWSWGPIGIWLGNDFQEVCYNRIFNYRAENPNIEWPNGTGGGADGGAFEIDDARNDKSNIAIHHNYTRDCQGFLEVTWSDVKALPEYRDFNIHHNISDDYQQFIALWRGAHCRIDNNTIIRRKVNANDWGVFNITQPHSGNLIRNNIIVVEKNIVVFNTGLKHSSEPGSLICHNLYYAASGELIMGKEGPGVNPVFGDPALTNYSNPANAEDYEVTEEGKGIDRGMSLGYMTDFRGNDIPFGNAPDIGAFEFQGKANP